MNKRKFFQPGIFLALPEKVNYGFFIANSRQIADWIDYGIRDRHRDRQSDRTGKS